MQKVFLFSILCMPLIAMGVDVELVFRARVLQNPSPDCRQPLVSARRDGRRIIIDSNGIPDHQNVGECNGNVAEAKRHRFEIPNLFAESAGSARPPSPPGQALPKHCVSSLVGVMKNGIPLYYGHNVSVQFRTEDFLGELWGFDDCEGHTAGDGTYHYHYYSPCINRAGESASDSQPISDEFVGLAMDGYPIYGPYVSALGGAASNADLDECHGADFNDGLGYRYILNDEFPYSIGCFRGRTFNVRPQACDGDIRDSICLCPGGEYDGGYGDRRGGRNHDDRRRRGDSRDDSSSEEGQEQPEVDVSQPEQQGQDRRPQPQRPDQSRQRGGDQDRQRGGDRRGNRRGGRGKRQAYGGPQQPATEGGYGGRRGNGEPSLHSSPVHITSPVSDACVPTDQCLWELDEEEDSNSSEDREEGPINPREEGPVNPREEGPVNPREEGPVNPREEGPREEGPRGGFPVNPEGGVDVDIIGSTNPENDVNLRLLRLQDQREQTEFNVDMLEGQIMHIERNQVECIRRFYAADNHVDRDREYSMYYELQGRMNDVSQRLEQEMENLDELCEEIERMEEDVLRNYGFGGGFRRPDQQFGGAPRRSEGDRQRGYVEGQRTGGRAARYNRY